jgi:hypothetical protein
MYIYIWIEGEKNLDDFCLKRFGDIPRFIEHHGAVAGNGVSARVIKTDKDIGGGDYRQFFFLYMEHEKGQHSYYELEQIMRQPYEEIRLDRTAILRR